MISQSSRPAHRCCLVSKIPQLVNALLEKALKITCVKAPRPDRCLKRKKVLVQCAKSNDVRTCLEKHAVLLKCLKAKDVSSVERCVTTTTVACPRSAIFRVTFWKAVLPLLVKPNVTFGWFVTGSKLCFGPVISFPDRAARSRSTNCGPFASSATLAVRLGELGAATTVVPCGTEITCVFGGWRSPLKSRKRSLCFSAGPASSLWFRLLKR